MKFVPFRLFRFLHPVDIEKNIKTHFEATLEELTRQNSDYHREIIQLGNQIIQLSRELEATKQELEESKSNWADMGDKCQELSVELNKTKQLLEASKNKADHYEGRVIQLTDVCNDRNREREILFRTVEAHRDAARVIFAALVELGHESQQTMSFKKPKG
jgi:chromosome segregation ATPase